MSDSGTSEPRPSGTLPISATLSVCPEPSPMLFNRLQPSDSGTNCRCASTPGLRRVLRVVPQAAFAAKAFGMWRFVAVTQRKFREHDRAQAMLQNRFDTMEVLYKTEQAATRDLEGKVAYLNSRIEELELELNMKQKDYDLLHKRMRAESVRLQAELEVMRTELADKVLGFTELPT